MSEEATDLFRAALEALEPLVWCVPVDVPSLKDVIESEAIETLWAGHSGPAWSRYLKGVRGSIKSLADLVKWHSDHPVSTVCTHTHLKR